MKAFRGAVPDLYKYTNYQLFLTDYWTSQKIATPAFSRRIWSTNLGIKSPATLTMILRGNRKPSPEIVDRLTTYFGFNSGQRSYFETLVKYAKSRNRPEVSVRYAERLRDLNPRKDIKQISYDLFAAVSNWECWTIREMVQSADFREDPTWIARKLCGRVSPKRVSDAIETLLKAELLTRNSDGKLIPRDTQIGTLADHADEAVKRAHEQLIAITLNAIRTVPVENRDIGGTTFNMDPADLPALKEELRRARKEIYSRFEKLNGTATFQLGFHLVPLTDLKMGRSR